MKTIKERLTNIVSLLQGVVDRKHEGGDSDLTIFQQALSVFAEINNVYERSGVIDASFLESLPNNSFLIEKYKGDVRAAVKSVGKSQSEMALVHVVLSLVGGGQQFNRGSMLTMRGRQVYLDTKSAERIVSERPEALFYVSYFLSEGEFAICPGSAEVSVPESVRNNPLMLDQIKSVSYFEGGVLTSRTVARKPKGNINSLVLSQSMRSRCLKNKDSRMVGLS
ncbi:hypothetical protein MMH89_04140 [Candidatus Comchoanobacter bicostacola]|uniref:Uncharacterized protein n=1 Tax=Candidatus Comchoanobacter bicostacola TaxID=2919598 RepID=A0ABY5DK99_9GAMM|nr:hypothetical protein [Candidatus Comchoanobacter bicostacola]UTC24407.1 hypothetical protein MMH89_04140 [Candidatus Comchoanobacter bicostacola]